MHGKTVLVVEDDEPLRDSVSSGLRDEGYSVLEAGDADQALKQFQSTAVDLVLLDVRLPNNQEGFEVGREILEKTHVPIIFMTALKEKHVGVKAFTQGAVDFIRKPFEPDELIERIKKRIKESNQSQEESVVSTHVLSYGGIRLDTDSIEVRCGEKLIKLTERQFLILRKLLSRPSRTFTHNELMEAANREGQITEKETLRTHIKNLRFAFRAQGCSDRDSGDPVETVVGFGYKIQKPNCRPGP